MSVCNKQDESHTRKKKPHKKSDRKGSKIDNELSSSLKHIDTFYNFDPPGTIKDNESNPEESIPNCQENKDARDFLSKAPTKGLWMPLGKEVKVMKCWRCGAYGHRTGDRECPQFMSGNTSSESFRYMHEDPMHDYFEEKKRSEKEERIRHLQSMLDSTSSSSSSSSSECDGDGHKNHRSRKRKTKTPKETKDLPKKKSKKSKSKDYKHRKLKKQGRKEHRKHKEYSKT